MKWGLMVLLALGTLGATPTRAATIPRGTVIYITVLKDIRIGGEGTNNETHKVKLQVTQDIVLSGLTIVKAGDLAEGEYTNQTNVTRRVFSANKSQELALDVDDVVNFCGDLIHVGFERTYVGGARGGFLSLGVHAHDAVFAKGAVLKATTDRAQKNVCAEATTATPAPAPSPLVLSDEEAQGEEDAAKAAPNPSSSPR